MTRARTLLLVGLALLAATLYPPVRAALSAPSQIIQQQVAVCDPYMPTNCERPAGGSTATLTVAQVSVTTGSTALVAARSGRRTLTISNITGTFPVYCTSAVTATAANGFAIAASVGATITLSYTGGLSCIAPGGAQTVSVTEIY